MSISESNKKIFSREAASYAKAEYVREDEINLAKKYFKEKKILILGCGAGRTIKPFYELGYEIVAIDIVPEMIKAAKQKYKDIDVDIFEMDAADLDFEDNSFDIVFFPFHGIDYVEPNIYAAVEEAKRVLKEGGVFIFNSHNRYFIKRLNNFFDGSYAVYNGLKTYRTGLRDRFILKKYFKKVIVHQRVSLTAWSHCNWKDKVYRLVPFFNKSTYFVCYK